MATKKLNLKLVGKDGNAFFLLGYARSEAKKKGWTDDEIKKLMDDAKSGDYQHLLSVLMEA